MLIQQREERKKAYLRPPNRRPLRRLPSRLIRLVVLCQTTMLSHHDGDCVRT